MRRLLLLVFIAFTLTLVPTGRAQEPSPSIVTIGGSVRDESTDVPISGAMVRIGTTTTWTDEQGQIPKLEIPLDSPTMVVDIVVAAENYGPSRAEDLELTAGQSLALDVKLRRLPPSAMIPAEPQSVEEVASEQALANLTIDPYREVDVGRTFSKGCVKPTLSEFVYVERMRFVDYVRNVLPNEWVASWPDEALNAGAIAVKQFGWYTAFVQQKWREQGYPFDLIDNPCDQFYKDNSADPRTNAAFERTWHITLTRDGKLVPTFYRAKDEQCPAIPGCMGQWGTFYRAGSGQTARDMLMYYYAPAAVEDPSIVLDKRVYLPLVSR